MDGTCGQEFPHGCVGKDVVEADSWVISGQRETGFVRVQRSEAVGITRRENAVDGLAIQSSAFPPQHQPHIERQILLPERVTASDGVEVA